MPDRSANTLREALAFFLEDDHYLDRLEAEGLKDLILRDGVISPEEKAFLEQAIASTNFDERALGVLKGLLDRADNQGKS